MTSGGTGARHTSVAIVAVCAALVAAVPAAARPSVRSILRGAPALAGLPEVATPQFRKAADLVLETGVRNLPIHPASSTAYTYRYDPGCDCYQRVTDDLGPWFITERAQPIGWGLLGIGITLGEYDMHGCNDTDRLSVSAGAPRFRAGIERIYQVATLTVTYGLTEDLDVSLALPVAALDFGVDASVRGGTTGGFGFGSRHVDVGPNLMDMMVRAKYRLFDRGGFAGAMGLRARLPTGSVADALGTGDGEVGPYFALSTSFLQGWLDSHWDGGFDADVNRARRSSVHYSWALDVQPPRGSTLQNFALTSQFVGRSEIAGVSNRASVSGPHVGAGGRVVNEPYLCLDPSRHDYFDMILGLRVRLVRSLVLTLGTFKSLNEGTGVRAHGFSPVGSLEATF